MFFIVDKSKETLSAAPHLAKKIAESERTARDFNTRSCFAGAHKRDLKRIVFLGHAHTKGFGEFDADEFVAKFNSDFEQQFAPQEKANIKDIYLIGCEVGLASSRFLRGETTLAQEIADKLYKAGFTNVVIHAVKAPAGAKEQGMTEMRVGIISGNSSYSMAHRVYEGGIKAFWLTAQQAEQLKAYPKNEDQIIPEDQIFLLSNDPIAALDRKDNLFFPKDARRPAEDREKNAAIAKLYVRIDVLTREVAELAKQYEKTKPKSKNKVKRFFSAIKEEVKEAKDLLLNDGEIKYQDKKTKLALLEHLVDALEQDITDNWERHVQETLRHATFNGLENLAQNANSSTKQLLEEILENRSKTKKTTSLPAPESDDDASSEPSPRGHRHATSSAEAMLPLLSREPAPAVAPVVNFAREAAHAADRAPNNVHPQLPRAGNYLARQEAKRQIDDYLAQLDRESRSHCCFSFFGYLGAYKKRKFAALRAQIETDNNPLSEAWKQNIAQTYNNSWFITWGGSKRAVHLITNILHNDATKGINPPVAPLTENDLRI